MRLIANGHLRARGLQARRRRGSTTNARLTPGTRAEAETTKPSAIARSDPSAIRISTPESVSGRTPLANRHGDEEQAEQRGAAPPPW